MAKDIEKRLSTLEANHVNYSNTQAQILQYIKEGRPLREETIKILATVAEQAKASLEYQKECDTERKEHNGRITSLETSRTKQSGMVAGISFAVTGIGGLIGWAFEHWGKS